MSTSGSGSFRSGGVDLPSDPESVSVHNVASFIPRHIASNRAIRNGPQVCEEIITAGILFMDVSGFTKLSETLQKMGVLGIEALTVHLNSYFGTLIDTIDEHGGDVIKIAGDALVVIWKVMADDAAHNTQKFRNPYIHPDMKTAIRKMIDCSMKCIKHNQSYKISTTATKSEHKRRQSRIRSMASAASPASQQGEGKLKIHCAIACGNISGIHCGGFQDNWEFLVCNKTIFDELKVTLGDAQPGEIVLGKTATAFYNAASDYDDHSTEVTDMGEGKCKITYRESIETTLLDGPIVEEGNTDSFRSGTSDSGSQNNLNLSKFKGWVESMNLSHRSVANLLSYTQSVVRGPLASGHTNCMAEMRKCSILFVSLLNISFEEKCMEHLQSSLMVIQKAVLPTEGFIRQYIMDDKGCVAIVAYGVPGMAHEDDVKRCAFASIEIMKKLQEIGIESSMGITTGKVYCGEVGNRIRREYALVGDNVNTAAHMMSKKMGILCDEATWQQLSSYCSFEKVEGVKLKGKAEGIPIYRLLPDKPISMNSPVNSMLSHSESKKGNSSEGTEVLDVGTSDELVGREVEQSKLEEMIIKLTTNTSAKAPTGATFFAVSGDAGIGKTALVNNAFRVARASRVECGISRSTQTSESTSFSSWKDFFLSCFSKLTSGGPEAKIHFFTDLLHKLQTSPGSGAESGSVEAETENPMIFLPLFGEAFEFECPENSMTQSMTKDQRENCVQNMLLKFFRSNPNRMYLCIFEQGEWIDNASWDLIFQLTQRAGNVRLIVTFRSEHSEKVKKKIFHNLSKAEFLELPLGPLGKPETVQLICHLLKVLKVPFALSDFVMSRSQGVPLLVEEVTRYLVSKDIININGVECTISKEDLQSIPFPDNIEGLIVQRIDALDSMSSLLLKVASVIGMIFTLPQVRAIFPVKKQLPMLEQYLQSCVRKELLVVVSRSKFLYSYKLEVVRQVSYNMLLNRQRKKMHRIMAHVIEKENTKDVASKAPILAYHYEMAESYSKCIHFYGVAAQKAYSYAGYSECSNFLHKAFSIASEKSVPIGSLTNTQWGVMMADSLLYERRYQDADNEYKSILSEMNVEIHSNSGQVWRKLLWHNLGLGNKLKILGCGRTKSESSSRYAEPPRVRSTNRVSPLATNPEAPRVSNEDEAWDEDADNREDADSENDRTMVGENGEANSFSPLICVCFTKLAQVSIYSKDYKTALYHILKALDASKLAQYTLERAQAESLLCVVYALQNKYDKSSVQCQQVIERLGSSEFKFSEKRSTSLVYSNVALANLMMGNLNASKNYYTTGLLRLSDTKSSIQHEWISNLCLIQLVVGDVPSALKYWKQLSRETATRPDLQLLFLFRMIDLIVYFRSGLGSVESLQKGFKDFLTQSSVEEASNQLERDIASTIMACLVADVPKIIEQSNNLSKYGSLTPMMVIAHAFCSYTIIKILCNKSGAESDGAADAQTLDDLRQSQELFGASCKVFQYMKVTFERFEAYHELYKGNKPYAQQLFQSVASLKPSDGYKFDIIASKYELKRTFGETFDDKVFQMETAGVISKKSAESFDFARVFLTQTPIF